MEDYEKRVRISREWDKQYIKWCLHPNQVVTHEIQVEKSSFKGFELSLGIYILKTIDKEKFFLCHRQPYKDFVSLLNIAKSQNVLNITYLVINNQNYIITLQ